MAGGSVPRDRACFSAAPHQARSSRRIFAAALVRWSRGCPSSPAGTEAVNSGHVSDATWARATDCGWSDEQLAEAFAYLGLTVFTAYFLNYAAADRPRRRYPWQPGPGGLPMARTPRDLAMACSIRCNVPIGDAWPNAPI